MPEVAPPVTGVGDGTGGLFAGAGSEVDAVGIRLGGLGGAGLRFLRDPRAVVGLAMVATVVLTAVLAPALAPFDPGQQDLTNVLRVRRGTTGSAPTRWVGTS